MYLPSSKLYRRTGHILAGECICLKGPWSSFASLPHPTVVHSTPVLLVRTQQIRYTHPLFLLLLFIFFSS